MLDQKISPVSSATEGEPEEVEYQKELEIIKRQANVKDVVFEKKPDLSTQLEVKLDTNLTPALEAEGYSREVARLVQGKRKQAGLKKEQKIILSLKCDKELANFLKKHLNFIKERVNAKKIDLNQQTDYKNRYKGKIKGKEIEIEFRIA